MRHLTALLHSLERLETEVVYGLTYLADAFATIARDYPECRGLYSRAEKMLRQGHTAREAWREGLIWYRRHSSVTAEDLRPLEKAGVVLGLSSAADQQRHLRLVCREVDVKLADARERLPQVTKLCRTLGVFGGLASALLLF